MSAPKPPSRRSWLAPYKAALDSLSARTKVPISSLVVSFAVLHEITAIVPFVSLFFVARSFGLGERTIQFITRETPGESEETWLRKRGRVWVDEGAKWAERVGRRYGYFGFPKTPKDRPKEKEDLEDTFNGQNIVGNVANAVFAYGVTKALLPARIGLSLYLAPAFSRRLLEPLRTRFTRTWR